MQLVMEKPFLDFYHACMETGEMPEPGLCENEIPKRILKIFTPTDSDLKDLFSSGNDTSYWGYEYGVTYILDHEFRKRQRQFTPLRQNIVLLCAAINNEL
jgi:hypothetical protein